MVHGYTGIVQGNPWLIRVETTTRCNAKCSHCPHGYQDFGQDMGTDLALKVRTSLFPSARTVDLTGQGEPLLAPESIQLVEACLRSNVRLQITTNGLLLEKTGLLPRLLRGNVELRLSIDGATRESFEFVRPTVKWDRMMRTIDYMEATKQRVGPGPDCLLGINFVVMKQNVADLPELVRLAARCGATNILLIPLSSGEGYERTRGQSLDHAPQLFIEPYLEACKVGRRLKVGFTVPRYFLHLIWKAGAGSGWRGQGQRLRDLSRLTWALVRNGSFNLERAKRSWRRLRRVRGGKEGLQICPDPLNSTYVASDGRVYACCGTREVLGDLTKQSWGQIWNGPLYRNLRRTMNSWNPTAVCRTCACWWGIVEGDSSRLERYFSGFRAVDVPWLNAESFTSSGFEEPGSDGSRWMGTVGTLGLPLEPGARFLRLRIEAEPPGDRRNPGFATVNGGPEEPFDNSCAEIYLPVDHVEGNRMELRLEMERVIEESGGLSRALRVTGLQYLV